MEGIDASAKSATNLMRMERVYVCVRLGSSGMKAPESVFRVVLGNIQTNKIKRDAGNVRWVALIHRPMPRLASIVSMGRFQIQVGKRTASRVLAGSTRQ